MFGFLFRGSAQVVVVIKKSRAVCVKGKISQVALSDLSLLCKERGISSGEVHLDESRKSKMFGIPEKHQQRVRNVLFSS